MSAQRAGERAGERAGAGTGAGGEREVRALPVVAVSVIALTIAAIVFLGRGARPTQTREVGARHGAEPTPVREVDNYTPGSPPAVAERFFRAWQRARYEEARELSTGETRALAERRMGEVARFNAAENEELRHTRAYLDAAHFDLEHIALRDLPASPEGHARKEVTGQAHGYANFPGTRMDTRRGQTFELEMVDGAWRVSHWTWETFR